MTRTKVLLAFGLHAEPGMFGADRRFFSKAVSRFFNKKIRKRGAALIMESFDMGEDLQLEGIRKLRSASRTAWEAVNEEFRHMQEKLEETSRKFFENGEMPPELAGASAWGFEELLLSSNRVRPGTVKYFAERASLKPFEAQWDSRILKEDFCARNWQGRQSLDIMIEYIKKMAEMIVGRDKAVFNLARRLVWQDPQRAIIMPRGFRHHGMQLLFDKKDYDVTVEMGQDPSDMTYSGLIACKSYQGELPKEVYEQYGTLEALLWEKLDQYRSENPGEETSVEGAIDRWENGHHQALRIRKIAGGGVPTHFHEGGT
jgi:hypothetical protein